MALSLASAALTVLFQPVVALTPSNTDVTYFSEGRRDPFASPRATPLSTEPCSVSVRCHSVEALELRGIVRTPRGAAAMVSVGGRSYLLRRGDAVRDAIVTEVSDIHVTFEQAVSDPLSERPTREVMKSLRILNARLP